jgi:hypothetical protein
MMQHVMAVRADGNEIVNISLDRFRIRMQRLLVVCLGYSAPLPSKAMFEV